MGGRAVRVIGLVVGVSTLAACGAPASGGTVRDGVDVPGKVTAIRLAAAAGSVTVRGSAQARKTTVHRVVQYRGGRPGRSYSRAGGTLTLRDCGRQCAVDYTVDVPSGVAVSGSVEAGAIRLAHVGRAAVSTESGAIEVTSATGPVTVRTGIGPIDLTVTRPSDVRATTPNGGIDLTVPKTRYRVSARVTGAGNRTIGVRNDPSAAHRLDLTTGNGDIDVSAR